mmetsp:Transcript_31523/g.62455  ORF Transcript_31523/g.62455 Transcript_31523/m.62455 type:complete len:250 (-) Transcript_31523:209-958(-)
MAPQDAGGGTAPHHRAGDEAGGEVRIELPVDLKGAVGGRRRSLLAHGGRREAGRVSGAPRAPRLRAAEGPAAQGRGERATRPGTVLAVRLCGPVPPSAQRVPATHVLHGPRVAYFVVHALRSAAGTPLVRGRGQERDASVTIAGAQGHPSHYGTHEGVVVVRTGGVGAFLEQHLVVLGGRPVGSLLLSLLQRLASLELLGLLPKQTTAAAGGDGIAARYFCEVLFVVVAEDLMARGLRTNLLSLAFSLF